LIAIQKKEGGGGGERERERERRMEKMFFEMDIWNNISKYAKANKHHKMKKNLPM
jgi:hypothetical protein